MAKFRDLQIRQLDEALRPYLSLRQGHPPSPGWARTIREALGMSLRQVAARAGLSATGVRSAEMNEATGSVQLRSLRRLAEAMDCELVYALVPRRSLQAFVDSRAERIARGLVSRVSESMELEDQGIPEVDRERQVEEMKQKILRSRDRDFWND